MKPLKIDGFCVLLVALGAAAAGLILVREATYGVALSWDSARYLEAVRSLLAGEGLGVYEGVAYQPLLGPLFPLLSALVGLFGVEALHAVAYVNAVAFGVTVLVVSLWLKHRVRSRLLIVWAACACALTIPLAHLAARAMADILFIAFVVASLFALDRFMATNKRLLLIVAAACAAAACLTRNVGVTLVASGLLALWLHRGVEPREKARNAAIWLAVIALPGLVWAIRNVVLVSDGYGVFLIHSGAGFSALASLHVATQEMAVWMYGNALFDLLSTLFERATGISFARDVTLSALLLKAVLVLGPAIALAVGLVRWRPGFASRNRDPYLVCFSFLAIYALFLMGVLPVIDLTLPSRYLLPMYPILLVVAAISLAEFVSSAELPNKMPIGRRLRSQPVLLLLLGSAWLLPQVHANVDRIKQWNVSGFGYGGKQALDSEVLRYLATNPPADRLMTSDKSGFYFWTGRMEKIDGMARQFLPLQSAIANSRAAGEALTLALTYRSFWQRPYRYDLDDLDALPGLRAAAFLEDGLVFETDAGKALGMDSIAPTGDLGERALRALVGEGSRVARARFDVYFNENSRRLVYVRDACGDSDRGYVGPRFFLHVFPANRSALPEHRQETGFEALDFHFNHYGGSFGDRCIASRTLPPYALALVRTGQHTFLGGERNWTSEFVPGGDAQ